jgi:2-iminobutanoate/2-iminopropanoate deaminase
MTGDVRRVEPSDVPKPPGNFVYGIVVPAGMEMMFVSGQTPDDLDGTVPTEFADQARIAWRNVTRTLAGGGFALADEIGELIGVLSAIRETAAA